MEDVYLRLESFGEGGRQAYQKFTYSGDAMFPLSFLLFLWLFAKFVAERTISSKRTAHLLVMVPVCWFLVDATENLIIYLLTLQYPARNDLLASVLGPVTQTKFALLLAALLVPTVLLVNLWRRGSR